MNPAVFYVFERFGKAKIFDSDIKRDLELDEIAFKKAYQAIYQHSRWSERQVADLVHSGVPYDDSLSSVVNMGGFLVRRDLREKDGFISIMTKDDFRRYVKKRQPPIDAAWLNIRELIENLRFNTIQTRLRLR